MLFTRKYPCLLFCCYLKCSRQWKTKTANENDAVVNSVLLLLLCPYLMGCILVFISFVRGNTIWASIRKVDWYLCGDILQYRVYTVIISLCISISLSVDDCYVFCHDLLSIDQATAQKRLFHSIKHNFLCILLCKAIKIGVPNDFWHVITPNSIVIQSILWFGTMW